MQTKTNWEQLECIFSELPKTLINRVDKRIKDWDEWDRVKHISKKIKQDWSFNSLILDELARVYSIIWSYYDSIESWLTREQFINIYCRDKKMK